MRLFGVGLGVDGVRVGSGDGVKEGSVWVLCLVHPKSNIARTRKAQNMYPFYHKGA